MREEINNLKNQALSQIVAAKSVADLEEVRIAYLGRSGKLTIAIKEIKNLELTARKHAGILINETKQALIRSLASRKSELKQTSRDWFDATIPGIKPKIGHLHLVTQAIEEIARVFEKIGFVRQRYPEVEWDWYAFETLNMPPNHPARDEWETFFVDAKPHPKYGSMILTPHTSSGQIREIKRVNPPAGGPIRMINIAKCYRRQSDVSHTQMFHQFEGLVIDRGISITHLKGTLDYFAQSFFGPDRKTRLRPFHFQFTEPSFEVDITCGVCKGKGRLPGGQACKLCKAGWLELGGAGMVHPTVLKNGDINPQKYTGFAFGWGVERVLMMKSDLNIPDLRILYSPNLQFLEQF